MKEYLPELMECTLFESIPENELLSLLSCLNAQIVRFPKGSIIFHQGQPARNIGVVLKGSVQILGGDVHGTPTLLTTVQKGDIFGETLACANIEAIPVNVTAVSDSLIMLLDHNSVIVGCGRNCNAHMQLIKSLLRSTTQKNLHLTEKLEILSHRTTRAKLLAYLRLQQKHAGSITFSIPMDRQALADYLTVERSAMSTELNKLKKEGLIDFHKNVFRIYEVDGKKSNSN